jgi:hypothetical protein
LISLALSPASPDHLQLQVVAAVIGTKVAMLEELQ